MEALPASPDTIAQTTHFQFFGYGEIDRTISQAFIQTLETSITKIESFAGKRIGPSPIHCFFYPTQEIKGLMLQNSAPCQLDVEKREIHLVVNNIFADHYLGKSNELLLADLLGAPNTYALQAGTAIFFSEKWQKMGYPYWAGKLLAANQLPDLGDLLNNQKWEPGSDLIYGSAAAAFCDFLINRFGNHVFLEKYKNWNFSPFEISTLEPDWKAYCSKWIKIAHTSATSPLTPYLKGFNFAHEGYRIYNGYGSRKAQQSLDQLKALGTNTVAIIPYSFTRHPKMPDPIPVVKRAGTENDESVIQSAEYAQSLGFSIVIKPQIWVGRGMWTGDIEMGSDADWELFFKHYGHWVSHYAMLAEIYGWEMLCIGTELVQTSLQRENNWRQLIEDIRSLYHGSVTYAANWGDEFENVTFWEDLDFIGLNCYYPLSKKENPSDRELKKGFALVIDKIEKVNARYNKPVIFTEIGFPCIKAAWKEPHMDWGEFETNSDHQRRCYEVVFNGIHNKPWCKGILWWKYPSDVDQNRRRETGFTPLNKAAENVVAKWFSQL